MKIVLSPVGTFEDLIMTKDGDSLWINGEIFDFGPLAEGSTLPKEAIKSSWFDGPVERENGQLVITIKFPHGGSDAPYAARYPEPIIMGEDGDVPLPDTTPVEAAQNE